MKIRIIRKSHKNKGVSGLQGPIDENEQRESISKQISIREDIKAIMQKQKEEEKERKKALQEQIQAIVEKQKQEDYAHKKALQEQIDAIMQKQNEEDNNRKRSVKEQIAARMEMAREEHIIKHHPDRIHDRARLYAGRRGQEGIPEVPYTRSP